MTGHNFLDLNILKRAAERTDSYLVPYGLEVVWSLTVIGLKLEATWGADKFERYIRWDELAAAPFDILEQVEQAALAGLSS